MPGTRRLRDTFNLQGTPLVDPENYSRVWSLCAFYAPLQRGLGGIRAKFIDQEGFTTFCNQRDFEFLLGLWAPYGECAWLRGRYVRPGEPGWYGFCADDADMEDELTDYAQALRLGNYNPHSTDRFVHRGHGRDHRETYYFKCDAATTNNPEPGWSWTHVGSKAVAWTPKT